MSGEAWQMWQARLRGAVERLHRHLIPGKPSQSPCFLLYFDLLLDIAALLTPS